ncbi:TatD family hydrolase [Flavobacterium sp. MAH-1]|uniref:TatD family hydrolase n=1 Tax=Flavobacterium agri TaxID=2743471 RepID=A0A7Y9C4W7_9FLAO|nr:TatD family hydrolase [Flavobacterium agri]NUY79759.1 TatD family hydrolase [Flavobacterium agri]NYA69784.1 TatD family hydrolase [Flavobacterium agri]
MKLLNLHTHSQTGNPDIFELVNQYPDEFDDSVAYFSIGIHPWRIDENRLQSDLQVLESKLADKRCLAIGECGLDKRIETPIGLQLEVFEVQLLLAEKYKKPVVIHCVAAYQEVIETKKRMNIEVPMIIHGFSKNEQVARSLVDNGFYLSFGKWLLRNPELESAFNSVPDDRFFLETDTAEESIEQVYGLAAKYRNVDLEAFKLNVSENFKTVFNFALE